MYPALLLVLLTVFIGREAGVFLEVAVGGEAQAGGNGVGGFVEIAEEALGFLRFFVQDKVGQGIAGLLPEFGVRLISR